MTSPRAVRITLVSQLKGCVGAALAVLAAAGCASHRVPFEVPADEVVEIQANRVARCRALGAVRGWNANGASVAENARRALEDVRHKVAHLGGNAFVVTRRTDQVWRSVVDADAYLCPSWEPVPGLAPR